MQKDNDYTHGYSGVGDVEHRPAYQIVAAMLNEENMTGGYMYVEEVEVDPVNNRAETESVDQVSQRATDDYRQCEVEQSVFAGVPVQESGHHHCYDQ